MSTWITWKNGKVNNIQQGKAPVGEGPWFEVPDNWGGAHGAKREWFDEKMRRIPDQELVKRGVRKDNRGKVFSTIDMSSRIINNLDEELAKDETKEPPLENESFQKFDQKTKKWVVDIEKKELAEEQAAVAQIQAQIKETENEMMSLVIAKSMGRATKEELAKLNELDTLIEETLKPELSVERANLKILELRKSA